MIKIIGNVAVHEECNMLHRVARGGMQHYWYRLIVWLFRIDTYPQIIKFKFYKIMLAIFFVACLCFALFLFLFVYFSNCSQRDLTAKDGIGNRTNSRK
jgi:hypothetical protein